MSEESTTGAPEVPSRPRLGRFRVLAPILSIFLALGLSACYAGRFDFCAAITVFPAWAWLVPGLLLASLGLRRRRNRAFFIAIGVWLLFLLIFAEEPRSLFRLAISSGSSASGRVGSIRVVSLNCDVGNRAAASEVAAHRPDIVLLQESPGREAVEGLARTLFGPEGGAVPGVDASIIARGRVTPAELTADLRSFFVQARVRLSSGVEVEVISTRLTPAVFRFDLWTPECWREQAENRRRRRRQVRAIADRIAAIPPEIPVILGGDFNAPQGDAVFRLLQPRLHDTFAEAGRGWGNTIINDVPCLRIDQVWTSGSLRASSVVARRTRNSDHRMVICDLAIEPRVSPEGAMPAR